jgi:hypothetical protein
MFTKLYDQTILSFVKRFFNCDDTEKNNKYELWGPDSELLFHIWNIRLIFTEKFWYFTAIYMYVIIISFYHSI